MLKAQEEKLHAAVKAAERKWKTTPPDCEGCDPQCLKKVIPGASVLSVGVSREKVSEAWLRREVYLNKNPEEAKVVHELDNREYAAAKERGVKDGLVKDKAAQLANFTYEERKVWRNKCEAAKKADEDKCVEVNAGTSSTGVKVVQLSERVRQCPLKIDKTNWDRNKNNVQHDDFFRVTIHPNNRAVTVKRGDANEATLTLYTSSTVLPIALLIPLALTKNRLGGCNSRSVVRSCLRSLVRIPSEP